MSFMWTIYRDPKDYPGKFVLRGWLPNPADPDAPFAALIPRAVVDTLDEARAAVPPGFVCTASHPHDDATIVETWL